VVCRGEALLANLFCRVGSEMRLGKHQKQYVTVSEPRRIPITTISQCSGDSSVALVPCVERLNVYPHAWSLRGQRLLGARSRTRTGTADPRDFKSTNDFRWEAENHANALYYRAYRSMYSALVSWYPHALAKPRVILSCGRRTASRIPGALA
jgi:hypothetical protein